MTEYTPMRCPPGLSRDNRQSWALGNKNYILYTLRYNKRAAYNDLPIIVSKLASLLYYNTEFDTNIRVIGIPSIDAYELIHTNKLDKSGFITSIKCVDGFKTSIYTNLPIELVSAIKDIENVTISVDVHPNIKLSYDEARILESFTNT